MRLISRLQSVVALNRWEAKYREIALGFRPIGKLYHAPFDVQLSDRDVFQPDIVFVGNDRLPILTRQGATGAPTLVVEILSPSTKEQDRTIKKDVYRRAGVLEYWLVDPAEKTITSYRLQESPDRPTSVMTEDSSMTSTCFPGLEINGHKVF